jgi:hypothetical protein
MRGGYKQNKIKNKVNEGKGKGSKKCEVQSSIKRRLITFNIKHKTNSADSERDNNLITDLACKTSLQGLYFGW